MKISNDVYTSLTPSERIRAAISAMARNDDRELQRLKETCPMRVFRCTDPNYADTMPLIFDLLLAMEADLLWDTLDFLIAPQQKNSSVESRHRILTRLATRHAGLRLFAEAEGIDFAELEACGPPRHPSVAILLEHVLGDEDDKEAAEIAAELREYVARAAC